MPHADAVGRESPCGLFNEPAVAATLAECRRRKCRPAAPRRAFDLQSLSETHRGERITACAPTWVVPVSHCGRRRAPLRARACRQQHFRGVESWCRTHCRKLSARRGLGDAVVVDLLRSGARTGVWRSRVASPRGGYTQTVLLNAITSDLVSRSCPFLPWAPHAA